MPVSLSEIARQAYSNKGARLSMAQIAEDAGVSRATVYAKLGTKADLLTRLAAEDGNPNLATDMDSRIMQGLQDVVAQTGLNAATIEDIATAAGVGVASIYRRFGDKDALFKAFIAKNAPVSQQTDLLIGTGSAREQLSELTRFLLDYMVSHKALVKLVHAGNADDRAYLQTLRDAESSTFVQITAFFRNQQTQGNIDPAVAPQDLAANLFGMLYSHTILSDGRKIFEIETVHTAILRMFEAVLIGDNR